MKQDIEKFKEIATFEEQFDFAETVLPKAFNQERQEEIIEGIRNQFQALPQEFQPATEAVDAFDLSLEGVIEETEILGDQTSGLQGNIVKLASAMSDSLPDWEANTLAYQSAGESLGFIGEQAEESGEFLDLFAESDAPQEFSNNWSRGLTAFVSSSQSATRSATSAFQNFASQSRNAISNSLFSLLQGDMKNFGNIWKNFAGSLLDTFTNTFTKLASNSIFSLFGLGGGGGLGDLFGGGGIAKQFVLGGGGSGGGGVKTLTLPV